MDLGAQIAKKLLQVNAIKLNPAQPFTWASGIKSPIYCDNRITLSYPDIRTFIKIKLSELSRQFDKFDTVAGVATAGIPHGALLADQLNLPFAYIRSKAKSHGRQNLIEGKIEEGARVLVVEDLISTGMSSLKAVDAVKETGAEVVGVIAIFSYDFPQAKEAFAKEGCPFKTLSSYPALLQQAVEQHYINEEQLAALEIWNQDPAKWAEKNT
ncbi:orotate phosphoribosyltransferase [Portibacter lacus]|uniref:Orotate phosphoribosyltransferase n=1 Tax=Portibacter lacus TaxID=1099794 RepID=A0AA37SUX1_9BACT|nr:orotate phosphoribosyltransferase [Portibacter lacus]GLR20044.1 orotate phosphoribosyltransferase [Portibacter lacus]